MANAATLFTNACARALVVGYPGSGKTGAFAPLANAGMKLRVVSFDRRGNMAPLLKFTRPDALKNIDIMFFEDKLRGGKQYIEAAGLPTAFADAFRALDHWKYTTDDGKEVDLGSSKDWGPDTIVIMDGITSQGEAAKRWAMSMLNKTPLNSTQQMWGLAMQNQYAFCERLVSSANRFHVFVLSHLKMVGPKDIARDDSDVTKEIKERLVELVPTRLFPSALGQALPPMIGSLFPAVVLCEQIVKGSSVKRVIRTLSKPELDLKFPADIPAELDISDGMLTVFNALTPGVEACLAAAKTYLPGAAVELLAHPATEKE